MGDQRRNNLPVRYVRGSGVIRLVRGRFYTTGEVAALLRVDVSTVWRWLRQGKLRAVTYGDSGPVRVTGEQIYAFLRPYVPPHKRVSGEKSDERVRKEAECKRKAARRPSSDQQAADGR